jgi:hypothetical protein
LAEMTQHRCDVPGMEQPYPSMDHSRASFQAGKALCSQWESQLVQLETGLDGYMKVSPQPRYGFKWLTRLLKGLVFEPASVRERRRTKQGVLRSARSSIGIGRFSSELPLMTKYKDLVLDIVMQQASRSQGTHSTQDTPFWHGKEFVEGRSPTSKISDLLSVSPGCEDILSTTVYSER